MFSSACSASPLAPNSADKTISLDLTETYDKIFIWFQGNAWQAILFDFMETHDKQFRLISQKRMTWQNFLFYFTDMYEKQFCLISQKRNTINKQFCLISQKRMANNFALFHWITIIEQMWRNSFILPLITEMICGTPRASAPSIRWSLTIKGFQ